MTITEQEEHAASLAQKGDFYIGLEFELGKLKSSRRFQSKWDAETWWLNKNHARLYTVYPNKEIITTKLSYAK